MTHSHLFLYGSLRDPALYRIVAGRELEGRAATLSDHCVKWVVGGNYPVIIDAPEAVAQGILVDADTLARDRMDFYELGFGYALVPVTVQTADGDRDALIYKPDPDAFQTGDDWSLSDWQALHGPLSREAAMDYMRLFGQLSPDEAAPLFAQIKSRAFSRLRARAAPSPAAFAPDFTSSDATLVSSEEPFVGFFSLRQDRLTHVRFDGAQSSEMERISLVGGDAVTVLPYDPETDSVLLVRQFRHGPFVRGDLNPWTVEPVAGRIDPGERAEDAARRELEEETGLDAEGLLRIGSYYPTPGAFSEHLTSYVAICDLSGRDGQIGGALSEHEDIMSHVVTFSQLMRLVETGAANTGPLLLSALWLAPRRDALRQSPT